MGSRTVSVTRERVGDEVFTGAARLQIGKFPNERAVDIQLRAECLSRFRLQDRIQVQIPALLTVDGLYIGQRNALSGEFQRSAGDRFIRIIACLDVKIPSRRLGIQDQISRRRERMKDAPLRDNRCGLRFQALRQRCLLYTSRCV